jgi:hypothetical protein
VTANLKRDLVQDCVQAVVAMTSISELVTVWCIKAKKNLNPETHSQGLRYACVEQDVEAEALRALGRDVR